MVPKPWRAAAYAFIVLPVSACGQPSSSPDAVGTPEVWAAEPDLRVGSVQGDDALTWFRSLQISGDGRIYTLHPMEQTVRVFAADGSQLGRIGGEGDGPGEFKNAFGMGWLADTLWVLDGNGYRFNLFNAEGQFLSSFTVPFEIGTDMNAPNPPRASALLFDGTVFGAPPAFSSQIADGTLTEYVPMLMNRAGNVTDTLPGIPFGRNQWAISDPDGRQVGGMYTRQPYADGPLWGFARAERAILRLDREASDQTQNASFQLTKLSFAGDTLFSLSFGYEPIPVSQVEADSILDAMTTSLVDRGFRGLSALEARTWAEHGFYRPAFRSPIAGMVLGRDGTIWLAEAGLDPTTKTWLVLNAAGEGIGRVLLPSHLNVAAADRTAVWGSETDDLDVTYLRRFRIRQPE